MVSEVLGQQVRGWACVGPCGSEWAAGDRMPASPRCPTAHRPGLRDTMAPLRTHHPGEGNTRDQGATATITLGPRPPREDLQAECPWALLVLHWSPPSRQRGLKCSLCFRHRHFSLQHVCIQCLPGARTYRCHRNRDTVPVPKESPVWKGAQTSLTMVCGMLRSMPATVQGSGLDMPEPRLQGQS